MRVALDTTFAGVNPTGVGIYSRRLAEHISTIARDQGMSFRCYGPSCVSSSRKVLGGLYQEWPTYTQGVLPLLLAQRPPDVVHSTSHLGPLWGPGRLVVTVHDLIFRRYPSDYNAMWLRITRTLLPGVLRRAAAVIADSRATADDLRHFYGVDADKITVVYPGVDDRFRKPVDPRALAAFRARFDIGAASYILCLGPWVRRKNIETVVAAFSQLAGIMPEVHLVVTGRPSAGMQSSPVIAALEGLSAGVRARVHNVGHLPVEELPPLVQGASLLAYPSRYEGFGLPPLEAMSAGVPVVASDAAAVVEATGGAALIARAAVVDDWVGAFHRLLTDPVKADELRIAGLAWSAGFTWERCANETVQLYKRVAKFI